MTYLLPCLIFVLLGSIICPMHITPDRVTKLLKSKKELFLTLFEYRFVNFTDDFSTWVFFYGPDGGEASKRRIQ